MFVSVVSTLEIVYVVFLAIYILLEKRSSAATLAWILMLALLPIVGFVLYFFLGNRVLLRKRMRHARARADVRQQHGHASASDVQLSTQLARLTSRASGASLATAREVRVLTNGKVCFAAIEAAIRGAKHHVHVEYYMCTSR